MGGVTTGGATSGGATSGSGTTGSGTTASDLDTLARPSKNADAQVNVALGLAKRLGKNPREVAEQIARSVDVAGVCRNVKVAGPGFLNITFDDAFLAQQLREMAAGESLGVRKATVAETVVVDYSAPNVAKEMHVGHLRSTIIGDALVRMLEAVGHRVVRENHIGDWGTPFGMLIEHLIDLGEDGAARELSVGDLDAFYKQARQKFDTSPQFQDRARQRVVALQAGDADTLRLWNLLVAESARYFAQVYEKLDVRLQHADLRGESTYNHLLASVVERLQAANLLQRNDDAEVVFPAGFTNRENQPLPLIIRKKDGGYNYATSDLACVIDRVENIGASLLVYVVGAPQAQHLSMVESVAQSAGWLHSPARMVHVAFGSVLGSDRKMLRSRSGEAVKLVELLDEAVQRADASIREKNPELDAEVRERVARQIGIGSVKYADLANDRVKDYVFDWERMLSFDGNTAPYLQYAHARICSIFRRAGESRTSVRGVVPIVEHPAERALALALLRFDSAVHDALDRFSPHRLCTYLYDLASTYTTFYEHCPVLKADGELRASRLALCDLTARVLERGLGML
ncbi:MAG: arginine--tRNA ligase, partial [Actinobacteria bacterium]|nr:arginine--tRNA ligase [Actinomycetota bacterium]NDE67734.1 arginine--tRNA ligase [Actinomycetota bacterium]